MRILVVEDENSIRTALARGLSQYGHRIETASCLAEARAIAGKRMPEVLLSDLKLPDGNGLDLAEELSVPFMLMTGYGTFDDAVRAMRLGCFDFFTKPVSIKELSRAMDHLAGRRAGGPLVVDGNVELPIRLTQPYGTVFATHSVEIKAVSWADEAEAGSAFDQLRPLMPSLTHRQVAAELMQASAPGRLVVNLHEDLWSACLEGAVDWGNAHDRRHLLEDLCRRCVWTTAGALVECSHG